MIGGPNLRYVRVKPPLLLLSKIFVIFVCACSEWPPGLLYFNICSIFLSTPPPDGPLFGTESNLPVSHPTPAIRIVDNASMIVRRDNLCLWA